MEGLEDRVKISTERNQHLTKEVGRLQAENKSLAKQLRDLQDLVSSLFPSKLQAGTAGTMLMVVVLSFSLFVLPSGDEGSYQVANGEWNKGEGILEGDYMTMLQWSRSSHLNTVELTTFQICKMLRYAKSVFS